MPAGNVHQATSRCRTREACGGGSHPIEGPFHRALRGRRSGRVEIN